MLRRLGMVMVVATLALLAAGCSDDKPTPNDSPHGTEFEPTAQVTVKAGERFSIVVGENASVGDMWEIKTQPDPKVAAPSGDDYVSDSPNKDLAGGGGKRYFIFTAKEPGRSTVELFNCFRGCQSDSDKKQSTSHVVDITVS